MDYSDNEQSKISIYQKRLANRKIKMQSLIDCIELLQIEYGVNPTEELKIEIKKQQKLLTNCKISVGINKRFIQKITCKNIPNIDINLLLIILNYLFDKSLINMLMTTKKFNDIIKNDYDYYIIHIYLNKDCDRTFKFPKQFFDINNIDLEQIFYVPVSKAPGRTLLHLIVLTNQLNIMKYLYKTFNNLNINVMTSKKSHWSPIHHAIYKMCPDMVKLLIDNELDYNMPINWNSKQKYNNLLEFSDKSSKYQKSKSKYTIPNCNKINNYIIDNVDKNVNQSSKTSINITEILQDKYILDILTEMYEYINNIGYNFKTKLIFKIIN